MLQISCEFTGIPRFDAPLRDRGCRSESGPRLSFGNGATFGPKVPYFTVYVFAGSHRLRAGAPDMRESSIVSADPGPPKAGAKLHGKTRHFSHFGRQFLDRVGFSSGKTNTIEEFTSKV